MMKFYGTNDVYQHTSNTLCLYDIINSADIPSDKMILTVPIKHQYGSQHRAPVLSAVTRLMDVIHEAVDESRILLQTHRTRHNRHVE